MELINGTNLQGGKYRIIEKIGQGGFGITYKAEDTLLERNVAIKEFFFMANCERQVGNNHVTYSSGNREFAEKLKLKFLKEAKRLAKFNHDKIVRIYDVFEENGTAYFVMEYIQSGSLDDLVCKSGKLTESKALAYIQELGKVIHFLHARKTCHLDIKPANILLAENGGIKLIDFGLSKQYDDSSSHTTTLLAVSKGYAPIEQYSQGGVSGFSPASDIYSLGATLYFLLKGDAPPDAIQLVVNGLQNIEKVSERTNAAIQHAMKANVKERPQNVMEWLVWIEKTNIEPTLSTKVKIHVKKPDITIVAQTTKTDLMDAYNPLAFKETNRDTEVIDETLKQRPKEPETKMPKSKSLPIIYWMLFAVVGFLAFIFMPKTFDSVPNTAIVQTVTDVDGNVYKTVKIASQLWMASNLKTTRYNDGTSIPLVTDNTSWSNLTTPGYCWYNNDASTNRNTYGAFYNWYTVKTGKLCPTGWFVPTDAEWTTLTTYLNGESVAGGKLKESGTSHWVSPNTGATNPTGFTALPGGLRNNNGAFDNVGYYGFWWSSKSSYTDTAWNRTMYSSSSNVNRSNSSKQYGFSVRCLRDY